MFSALRFEGIKAPPTCFSNVLFKRGSQSKDRKLKGEELKRRISSTNMILD